MVVSTSGPGYPLLLCLGESLVVILDYALTAWAAGPPRSEALLTRSAAPDPFLAREGSGEQNISIFLARKNTTQTIQANVFMWTKCCCNFLYNIDYYVIQVHDWTWSIHKIIKMLKIISILFGNIISNFPVY